MNSPQNVAAAGGAAAAAGLAAELGYKSKMLYVAGAAAAGGFLGYKMPMAEAPGIAHGLIVGGSVLLLNAYFIHWSRNTALLAAAASAAGTYYVSKNNMMVLGPSKYAPP
jgi:hypothetical protein